VLLGRLCERSLRWAAVPPHLGQLHVARGLLLDVLRQWRLRAGLRPCGVGPRWPAARGPTTQRRAFPGNLFARNDGAPVREKFSLGERRAEFAEPVSIKL
jgi:hypothetical protein